MVPAPHGERRHGEREHVVRTNESVLDSVRRACARVAGEATSVHIDGDAVAGLAGHLALEGAGPSAPGGSEGSGPPAPERDPTGAPGRPGRPDPWAVDPAAGSAEERARLVLTLAAINFGSGYHPLLRKPPGCSGATTMAAALREWAVREPLTAGRLTTVTAGEAHERFGQPPDGSARDELIAHLAAALVELGAFVLAEHGGSFEQLVASADGRAGGLVGELARMPRFADVAEYRGGPVPFYKRAQLAAADLDRAFAGRAPASFADLDDLTAFADNLVPHVLRVEGVLRYDDDLAARIDAGELVPAGSAEEVEIRAAGVHAVEGLRLVLAGRGIAVRASDLDVRLWRRGAGARYKAVPRHRTRSVFY